jgi:GMP synthase (glutamine-hydrolysing)
MPANIQSQRILIVDFGSQYTQLIARRIRECGVYSEIIPWDVDPAIFSEANVKGIILSGGPETVVGNEAPSAPQAIFSLGLPILGICYGMQTMAAQLGGAVEPSAKHEFGHAEILLENSSELTDGLIGEGGSLNVWMSHGDKVTQLPAGFALVASTSSAPIAAMGDDSRKLYGVQFHPEVTHTAKGQELLTRFAIDICGCDGLWSIVNIAQKEVDSVREAVGNDQVILGLSGGVDSSVVAALLHKAIGKQLTCVFVDNGLLRHNEGAQVMEMFAANMGVVVIRVDAEEEFLSKLAGVADPEQKRKIIGNTFIDIFEREAGKIENANWLAQGTIYPDVIESAASKHGKACD